MRPLRSLKTPMTNPGPTPDARPLAKPASSPHSGSGERYAADRIGDGNRQPVVMKGPNQAGSYRIHCFCDSDEVAEQIAAALNAQSATSPNRAERSDDRMHVLEAVAEAIAATARPGQRVGAVGDRRQSIFFEQDTEKLGEGVREIALDLQAHLALPLLDGIRRRIPSPTAVPTSSRSVDLPHVDGRRSPAADPDPGCRVGEPDGRQEDGDRDDELCLRIAKRLSDRDDGALLASGLGPIAWDQLCTADRDDYLSTARIALEEARAALGETRDPLDKLAGPVAQVIEDACHRPWAWLPRETSAREPMESWRKRAVIEALTRGARDAGVTPARKQEYARWLGRPNERCDWQEVVGPDALRSARSFGWQLRESAGATSERGGSDR